MDILVKPTFQDGTYSAEPVARISGGRITVERLKEILPRLLVVVNGHDSNPEKKKTKYKK